MQSRNLILVFLVLWFIYHKLHKHLIHFRYDRKHVKMFVLLHEIHVSKMAKEFIARVCDDGIS